MRLTLKGFKATDREVEIAKLNLVSATNGTGKSALADALRFLALGYVPALGKREQDTALLMGNGELSVTLALDDGRSATRTMRREAKGIMSTVRASWVRGSRAEHDAAILALFGSDAEDVAEALDIRELLSLTPAKRAARIEKMIGSGGSAEDLPRRVARTTVARLLDIEADNLPEELSQSLSALPPGRADILREIGSTLTAHLRESGIPPVIEWINDEKRRAEAEAAKRHAARDEIEARLQVMGTVLAIDDLGARRIAIQRQIGAYREAERREADRARRLETANAEAARLSVVVEDAEAQLARIRKTATEMIEALEAKIPALDEEIGVLKAQVFAGAPAPNAQRIAQIEAELAGMVDEPIEDLTRYERMVEEFEAELAGAKASPWAEVREIASAIDEVHSVAGWGARLRALAEANMPSTADTEAALAVARETLARRGDIAAEAARRNLDRANRRSRLSVEAASLRAQGNAASASVADRERKRHNEINLLLSKKQAAKDEIANQRDKVAAQERHVAQVRESFHAATTLAASLSQPGLMPEAPDTGELERIETALQAAISHDSLKREFDAIVADIERRDAAVEVLRAIEWALKRIREEELAARGAGIVGRLSDFMVAAGREELPYMEAGKNICDVGWVRADGRRVSVEAMSGGEYALFCSALTAAVLEARGGEVRLLLVEAAECDAETMRAMLAGIAASSVTHAMVLTAHDVSTLEIDGWAVTRLDAAEKARAAA